jgi:membrane protease subunit (stomatin/prohibitin family)
MSIWNTLKTHAKAQFLDVIEWLDDSNNTLVHRYPVFNQAIQSGGKLVVREGQAAVFIAEGQMSQVFAPGTYTLDTRTEAVWSFFQSIKYQLNYPYKGDIYFVNTRQYTDQKWGTSSPLPTMDPQLGPVRIRAYGIFSYRVKDAGVFLKELVGTQGLFTTEEINGQLKRKLLSAFADTLGEAKIPLLELMAQYMDLGDALRQRMSPIFEAAYGIGLTDFTVESITPPPEVEKMLDKRTSMGLIGDMNAYTQFQAANAIETAAARPGAANPMMDAGMGLAMGGMMGRQMAGGAAGVYNPVTGASAPPPPPIAAVFHYNGAGGQAQLSAGDVAARVAADRSGVHHVWAAGWAGWKSWSEVPEIVAMIPPAAPPPPPGGGERYHYDGAGGQAELSAADVAARLRGDPTGRHLVWKAGFEGWLPAADVPGIAALAAGGPPPLPGGPPPPPSRG